MNQNTQPLTDRAIDNLLAKYSESHLNPVNEVIHFICVPVIVFTLLGLLWAIHPWVALAGALAAMLYYFSLSVPFAVGMLLMSAAMLALLYLLPPQWVLPLSITVFVLAWIGQFIGHKIEGKKPSFFDDLRFLLIGPLFVLGFLYRRLHIAY
ncbi:putative membrane protein YGL010W [Collimonas sp. PA-H2]|uniref:Mpo1 family 2-hydroxy fatty acid dioxygenase n=1 Tax=Collimonas sp. PA-H2 TaxID=1881062 RepID=UPI000BF90A0F|nr:Mpo1-like protein [Collimonas sp. PA-H2]PFH08435.1 putative membrane protein YGL010W [Collimonas sp. PA-H2]